MGLNAEQDHAPGSPGFHLPSTRVHSRIYRALHADSPLLKYYRVHDRKVLESQFLTSLVAHTDAGRLLCPCWPDM